jgi:small subunit ribosomal protein S4
MAATRPQARQLVNHGHFRVNGKRVDIPSYQVRPGDAVSVKDRSKDLIVIQHSVDTQGRLVPDWIEVDTTGRQIKILSHPRRDQIDTDINEQLIVELYSK